MPSGWIFHVRPGGNVEDFDQYDRSVSYGQSSPYRNVDGHAYVVSSDGGVSDGGLWNVTDSYGYIYFSIIDVTPT